MSKGHGRVERTILEALKWHRLSAKQGIFLFGATAEDLVYYVRVGPALGSVATPTIEAVIRHRQEQSLKPCGGRCAIYADKG